MDFAIDARLAHAPGDQLRDLRAEVDDEDEVMTYQAHVAEEAGKRNPLLAERVLPAMWWRSTAPRPPP